ncbi:MAG: alpha-glucosidase [Candidatus Izemoplasmatales bacterium]
MDKKWWQKQTIYQIYLRSFFDSNNDGIGDIEGLRQKLGYLKKLGVSILWISPHYDSPMDDNGYDVRDFYQVSKDYGTIDDFRRMVDEAHRMDMKIITDLVLNHTSDEHIWFQKAKDPTDPQFTKYHDYYIWHKPKYDAEGKRIRPTRWIGWFGSPAWDYNEATDEYYLHIFSKKMPDLNWRNESLRKDIKEMIKWWLDLGIDGFRVDASNHLEKNWDFPDAFPGYENFSSIPKHHEYLRELGTEIFVPYDILTVGESGGASKEEALQYAGYGSNEFNMLIQFGHCWSDVDNNNPKLMGKWAKGKLRVSSIKQSFKHWYDMLEGKGWNVIYWHNHDQPRVLSHYGNDEEYHDKSAKMLAYALYFMPGTAIVYQGEEIGMTNVKYQDINEFRDVEVFTEYKNMTDRGLSEKEALQVIKDRCRDNARTPFQWNNDLYAGFSKVQPWINVNADYLDVNLEDEKTSSSSVYHTYEWILNFRKENMDILDGKIDFYDIDSDENYVYENKGEYHDFLVICNFTKSEIQVDLEGIDFSLYTLLLTNTEEQVNLSKKMKLSPYDAFVFSRKKS